MNWLRWPVFREVDPLLFSYFALLFAALFAVGDSFVLTIAPRWILCDFGSVKFTSCYQANEYYIRRPSSCTSSRGSRVVLVLPAGGIAMILEILETPKSRNFHDWDSPSSGLGLMRLWIVSRAKRTPTLRIIETLRF